MNYQSVALLLSTGLILTGNLIGCNSSPFNAPSSVAMVKVRDNYHEIDLKTEVPANAVLSGKEPESIARKVFITRSTKAGQETSIQQSINVYKSIPNKVIVMITRTGYADDSVKGVRYRVEFEPELISGQNGHLTVRRATTYPYPPQWRMIWVGKQYICQPGRGSQDWTPNLCS